jgi:RimJ/RimL family protein N-acetyltransferase
MDVPSPSPTPTHELHTPRLWLRRWRAEDRQPFAALNADPAVMRHFPAPLTRDESDRLVDAFEAELAARGWGRWAVQRLDTGAFIGFVGLTVPRRALPFMPCVEIGWRLAAAQWHQGFATEAARAALEFGFRTLALDEIVSFTAVSNRPSRAVMERLGMVDRGEDFDHPALAEGHPLRRHCLYRLAAERWRTGQRP